MKHPITLTNVMEGGDVKVKAKRKLSEIMEMARDGLVTDGGHHKQWYLEEIFKLAGGEITEEMQQSFEEGIAP